MRPRIRRSWPRFRPVKASKIDTQPIPVIYEHRFPWWQAVFTGVGMLACLTILAVALWEVKTW